MDVEWIQYLCYYYESQIEGINVKKHLKCFDVPDYITNRKYDKKGNIQNDFKHWRFNMCYHFWNWSFLKSFLFFVMRVTWERAPLSLGMLGKWLDSRPWTETPTFSHTNNTFVLKLQQVYPLLPDRRQIFRLLLPKLSFLCDEKLQFVFGQFFKSSKTDFQDNTLFFLHIYCTQWNYVESDPIIKKTVSLDLGFYFRFYKSKPVPSEGCGF